MSPAEVERYLHEHIPLSKAMQVTVAELREDEVVLGAPLAPNINHRETVFGGSASAIAILAAWTLLHTRLLRAGFTSRLVIQRNEMHYDSPVAGAFSARSRLREAERWQPFVSMLERRGKARIGVCATLEQNGRAVGRFTGDFVALHDRSRARC